MQVANTEKDWRELFTIQQVEKPFNIQTEPGECNANCLLAKELICRCKCHGKNHGARLREHVKSLDQFRPEDPVPFSPEQYLEELAILA